MPSPPTEEGSDVPTTEDYVQVANEAGQPSGQEVLGGARVSASATAAAAEARPTPTCCCCVCMEPWSCIGAHRICCIPCGHVYGRSCLEKWLGACSNTRAKCPVCGAGFEHKHIINIYTPGDSFDDCSHMQEVETHYSKMTEYREKFSKLLEQHTSENNLVVSKARAEFSKVKEIASFEEVFNHLSLVQSMFEMMLRQYTELLMLVSQNMDGLGEGDPK